MTKSAAWLVLGTLASGCASTPETAEAPAFPEKRFLNLPYRSAPNGYTHVVKSPPGTMVFLSGAGERTRLPGPRERKVRHGGIPLHLQGEALPRARCEKH